jgi:hypothetical protein
VYGVLGGRVSESASPRLAARIAAAYTTHRARRDQLTAMLRDEGVLPVPAEVSYALPNPARTRRQLTAVARTIEQRCAAVYAATVGSTAGAERQWAIDALHDAAVRELGFGGRPDVYPGLPEL